MNEKEINLYTLNDGLKELDFQTVRMKKWLKSERYSEAYVTANKIAKLMVGLKRTIERLEKVTK